MDEKQLEEVNAGTRTRIMSQTKEPGIKWQCDRLKLCLEGGSVAKLPWGSRSIFKHDWIALKKYIAENNVKTVLEYGVGLSTELMLLEGVEVVCFESMPWWADICKKAIGNEIILCEDGYYPDLDRRFDLALVDAPWGNRNFSTRHAMRHSDVVYLHDLRDADGIHMVKDWDKIEVDLSNGKKYKKHFFGHPEREFTGQGGEI